MKVLIVGAGIVGASIAWHLAQGGAEVTVLEAARPAAGASGRSFGWINASFYLNEDHFRLRCAGMAAWHRLAAALPAAAPVWSGALWFEAAGPGLAAMQADLGRLGYRAGLLEGPKVIAAEPALRAPPAQALHFPDEGAVDAVAATRALLAASGARVLGGTVVRGLIETGGRVSGLRTPMGPMMADHVVVAAGTGSPALLAPLGLTLPMLPRPGLILRTAPVHFALAYILIAPGQEVRQLPGGSLIAPCAASHQSDTAERAPDEAEARKATLDRLRALFGISAIEPAQVLLGHRPVPGDGLPVIGPALPGLSVAVMHSGVTLAALAGEAIAAGVLGKEAAPVMAPYAIGRFQ